MNSRIKIVQKYVLKFLIWERDSQKQILSLENFLTLPYLPLKLHLLQQDEERKRVFLILKTERLSSLT